MKSSVYIPPPYVRLKPLRPRLIKSSLVPEFVEHRLSFKTSGFIGERFVGPQWTAYLVWGYDRFVVLAYNYQDKEWFGVSPDFFNQPEHSIFHARRNGPSAGDIYEAVVATVKPTILDSPRLVSIAATKGIAEVVRQMMIQPGANKG